MSGPSAGRSAIVVVLRRRVVVWGIAGYMALTSAVSESNSRITTAARKALTPSIGDDAHDARRTSCSSAPMRVPARGQSRSDTMMLMRVDPNNGTIKYLSIPRDTLIDSQSCPSCGSYVQNQKINAAYFFQGEAGAIHTVEKFTGLPVNHIVVVSFDGLSQVVNDLGGITLKNPFALKACWYPGGIHVSFPKGTITLNGTTALQFVRVRHCDSDIQREERQQVFLSALKSKIVSPGDLWQAPWNAASLVQALSTDMSATDLAQLGWLEMTLSQPKNGKYVLPGNAAIHQRRSTTSSTTPSRAQPSSGPSWARSRRRTRRCEGQTLSSPTVLPELAAVGAAPADAPPDAPSPAPSAALRRAIASRPRRRPDGAWCRSRCCGTPSP